jgi:hypothetical protein
MNDIARADSQKQKTDQLNTTVLKQLSLLHGMSMGQLRQKWIDVFGANPPQYKRQFMMKRLAHKIQELYYGGLSQSAQLKLREIAKADPICAVDLTLAQVKKSNDNILPGTRMVRIWNERKYEVVTRDDGFEYDGRIFRSLSAIAREITGTRWNGRLFFGVNKSGAKRNGGD